MSTHGGGCILPTVLGVVSEDKAVFIILTSLRLFELWQQLNLECDAEPAALQPASLSSL